MVKGEEGVIQQELKRHEREFLLVCVCFVKISISTFREPENLHYAAFRQQLLLYFLTNVN